ncbi:Probable G-protein coupled receptor CG31760 [Gryllus bimaculatus]|nr:Probable G-protein coupled receptor CG31760 [Gryllus bimaculatus]
MYLEMAAIFPVLDTYSCIATKWSRHLGFCVTYTALLMKTWRVSLTYRVKSAHKVKLTDKQLLQWMFPILLVMLIYLGTWTLSAPPAAEQITDARGLRFRQCTYNWWDHALAIGEVLFLAWGIRVCYNVRHAESLFNEARLITYAIYNIALVNTAMVAFHLFILPHAGPDIKYLLGFIRTQLSTSVTVALVFGPKVSTGCRYGFFRGDPEAGGADRVHEDVGTWRCTPHRAQKPEVLQPRSRAAARPAAHAGTPGQSAPGPAGPPPPPRPAAAGTAPPPRVVSESD